MKFLKNLPFAAALLIVVLSFSACQEEDPYANLVGSFTLTSSTVDGASAGPVSGTMSLKSDKSGEVDIAYTVVNVQYTLKGNFAFLADDNTFTFNKGASDERVWTRVTDEKNKQSFSFNQEQAGGSKKVVLTFTK